MKDAGNNKSKRRVLVVGDNAQASGFSKIAPDGSVTPLSPDSINYMVLYR